jgi:hypothetical protein
MLETLREFGAEQLTASEREDLGRRQAAFFLDLVARSAPELTRAYQLKCVERLQQERDNLRAALAGYERRGESEAGLQLAESLWRFWWLEGSLAEGRVWLDRIARLWGSARTALWARAQARAALLALFHADHAACEHLASEALDAARALGIRPASPTRSRTWGFRRCDGESSRRPAPSTPKAWRCGVNWAIRGSSPSR